MESLPIARRRRTVGIVMAGGAKYPCGNENLEVDCRRTLGRMPCGRDVRQAAVGVTSAGAARGWPAEPAAFARRARAASSARWVQLRRVAVPLHGARERRADCRGGGSPG